MKKIISLYITVCVLPVLLGAQALISKSFPCYTVGVNNSGSNNLFEYDQANQSWTNVGAIIPTGDTIRAIASDPINDILYAYDAGNKVLGVIDPNANNPTLFTPINITNLGLGAGTGNGDYGTLQLDDIRGLTYDPINMILYASHNIYSSDICNPIPNTNDLLFQIDISTGKFVPGAMIGSNGLPADYAVIEEISSGTKPVENPNDHAKKQANSCFCTVGGGLLYDVGDIAYNPYTGELYASHNQTSETICGAVISILNPVNAYIEATILDDLDSDAEGLGFNSLGELHATSTNSSTAGFQDAFVYVDLYNQSLSLLPFPDPTGTYTNFEAFDCLTKFNDLALDIALDVNTPSEVYPAQEVTFNITVYNQGNFDNFDILVTDYIPAGLILNDTDWFPVAGTNTAEIVVTGPLVAGTPITVPITFTVDTNFTGTTIENYAEITASSNPGITDLDGNELPLPDIDSYPDASNNELTDSDLITDNEVNQGGPNANEDEDDHDIASISVSYGFAGNLSLLTTTTPASCSSLGTTEIILEGTSTPPYTHKWLGSFGSLIHLETNSNLVHQISGLQPDTYYAIVSDSAGKISSFVVTVPLMANQSGNLNCNINCPEYLSTPGNLLYGIFQAEEVVEINGNVDGTQNTEFRICE